ncbi:hypothetical protein ANCDUO_02523 [Ancylostoma duodenale]|uniref:Carboxylic ester hydrolase n=1 Tax=Ancylostoma duodenale TaxID=51022 RepID=A0A0C2HCA3_9BILA|nr:hypothetical protein ANCDUO_02523 [Ancylostoma duodenale]
MPGNLGLWDMAEALKFIHTNAGNFGGDPSSITVWGHSAGSAAVGQLILSPVTRDYIVRSIEMSGSPWGSWSLGSSVANNSLELAQALGCFSNIKDCMKRKSVEEIYNGIEQVNIPGRPITDPAPLFGWAIMRVAPPMQKWSVEPEDYQNWNRDRLISELHKAVKKVYIGDHLDELLKDIVSYYVERDEEQHFEFYIDRYTEFLSDLLFVVPSADGIMARSAAGWDMYAYSLDHYNEAIWDKDVPRRLKG